MKYLDIIIDSKLTFREHITQATEISRKFMFTLSRSDNLIWGLGHKVLRTIYTGGIQPLFLYGAPLWTEGIDKKSYRKNN